MNLKSQVVGENLVFSRILDVIEKKRATQNVYQ